MQAPPTLFGFATTVLASAVIGVIPILIVASADNGYVAGFIVLPLFLLVAALCIILFLSAIVFIANERFAIGLYLLLSVLLVPTFTVGSALAAKHFEIGAYKVEPMRQWTSATANKIVFKKRVTEQEVQEFWNTVLATPTENGDYHIAGVQTVATGSPIDGHKVLAFSFYENATDEEKADARLRILASPKVQKLIENGETTPSETIVPVNTSNRDSLKVANVNSLVRHPKVLAPAHRN